MLNNLFKRFFLPSFDWIQIEVSGFCNAKCFYCPHTVYREKWLGRNLTLEEFKSLLPYLKKTKLIYLQGWGEPLCNPHIFEMVKLAKEQGTMVGFTTNGNLIDEKSAETFVELDLDYIALSLTGITTNDLLRKGTSVERVLKAVDFLNHAKKKFNKTNPKINIAYMLLRSNDQELETLPEFLSNKGIDEVIVSFLDFIPTEGLKKEALEILEKHEISHFEERLKKILKIAQKLNLRLIFNFPHPQRKRKVCSENPVKSLFINSLGYVSPCVFTGVPTDLVSNVYFGNIKNEELYDIWNKREYKEFREKHSSLNQPFPCDRCPKMRIVNIF